MNCHDSMNAIDSDRLTFFMVGRCGEYIRVASKAPLQDPEPPVQVWRREVECCR